MKRGGGKGKGSEFERWVCKHLSLWISGGDRSDLFWRTAMSGGRATIMHRRGEKVGAQLGDISAVDKQGHILTDIYFIECKNYNDLAITSFLLKRKGTLYGFWEDVLKKSDQHNRSPMLIAKQDRYPPFVLLEDGALMRGGARANLPAHGCTMVMFDTLISNKLYLSGLPNLHS